MHWTDDGIVLSARPQGESSAVVQLLTRGQGRHAGLVRDDPASAEGIDGPVNATAGGAGGRKNWANGLPNEGRSLDSRHRVAAGKILLHRPLYGCMISVNLEVMTIGAALHRFGGSSCGAGPGCHMLRRSIKSLLGFGGRSRAR